MTGTEILLGSALGLQAAGQFIAGRDAKASADFQAAQMRQQAGQAEASAQRAAIAERKKADYMISRARAVAGASGASVSDPTVSNVIGDIGAEGEYQALTALFNGRERATGLYDSAAAKRMEGSAAMRAGYFGVASTAAQGAYLYKRGVNSSNGTSLLDKYG